MGILRATNIAVLIPVRSQIVPPSSKFLLTRDRATRKINANLVIDNPPKKMYNIQPLSPEIHNAHMHGHGARGGVRGTGVSLVLPRYRLSMSSTLSSTPAPCVAPKS